jgi:hypothetical protein
MTKRRRPRNKPSEVHRKRATREPDDLMALPGGYMARFGRFIAMGGTLSQEQHRALQEAVVSGTSDIRALQDERRSRLEEILNEADPADLVARASLTYLRVDPDTFKEWQDDRSPAHIEYLALQALGVGLGPPRGLDPIRAGQLTFEALEIVRQMFQSASMLIVSEAVATSRERPEDPSIEYILKTRLESLGVRGSGYTEHLERVIRGCLDPFERECRELLGFTAADAIALLRGLVDVIEERVEPRWKEAATGRTEMLRRLKRERRRRGPGRQHFPNWLVNLSPKEAKAQIGWLAATWLFADSRSLGSVKPEDLSRQCAVELSVARRFLDCFSCPPQLFNREYHSLPGGPHPLTDRPILPLPEGYLLPVPSSMTEAIRSRMEDGLHQDEAVWDRYVKARSSYLESAATALLAQALPGSKSWRGIPWRATSDEGDLDGLVVADDLALRVQCKAGRLSAQARRGAPDRIKRDVGNLIQEAATQHSRLASALREQNAVALGFSLEQGAALAGPLQFEVIVCLDDVTVWATEAHKLRRVGALPETPHVPWVLSLTDLMAVSDLLQGAELAHYLMRRQRMERDGRVEAHDELDWVGHYLKEGLFFDHYFEGDDPPGRFRLLSYTEPIDAWYFTRAGVRTIEAPRPSQSIPPLLRALIRRLEKERPEHWLIAACALLDGNQESRNLWGAGVDRAHRRLPLVGWSNTSQVFDGRLGVTLYIDHRLEWPEIRDAVVEYCQAKIDQHGTPNWIAVGEGATGSLFVVNLERDPGKRLGDVFVQPPSRAGSRKPLPH